VTSGRALEIGGSSKAGGRSCESLGSMTFNPPSPHPVQISRTVVRGGLWSLARTGEGSTPEDEYSGRQRGDRRSIRSMCRNLTQLRGLQPAATPQEIEAAARQYVRKVAGVQTPSSRTGQPFDRAVREIAAATLRLLADLPPPSRPPRPSPPLRRLGLAADSSPPPRSPAKVR